MDRNLSYGADQYVIVTGGGTGGHLFPALAVAEALRREKPELRLLYIGREHERDRNEVERRRFTFKGFPLEGLRRKITLGNISALWHFTKALWQCWGMMRRRPPGVVFGVGGYVSAPAMAAGKAAGWMVALHEQNTIPGLVNRLLASRCDRVFVTYESSKEYFKGTSCMTTGLPLRGDLLEAFDRRTPREPSETPSVLLIGGSQGARRVVETGLQAFWNLHSLGIEFHAVVQTGEKNYEWAESLPRPEEVVLVPFIEDMAGAYRDADVVLSRAGSGSLSEIALWGLPSILIPYPFASENHQAANAKTFTDAEAALAIEEKELTPNRLSDLLLQLLQDKDKRTVMGKKAESLARRDAAQVIAKELIRLLDL